MLNYELKNRAFATRVHRVHREEKIGHELTRRDSNPRERALTAKYALQGESATKTAKKFSV